MGQTEPVSTLPNYLFCYVCGDHNPLGLNVRFRMEGDDVVTTFMPTAFHAGYPGRVHGGVLATLLDETMGWAPSVRAGRFCLAVELSIRYLKPAAPDEPLTVRGRALDWTGRIWRAEGEVIGPGGEIYVRGSGRYWPLDAAQTDEVMKLLTVEGDHLTLAAAIEQARVAR